MLTTMVTDEAEMRVTLTGTGLQPAEVVAVARDGAAVEIGPEAVEAMERAAAVVAGIEASSEPAYGVSTGFGSLATTPIPVAAREQLQLSLLRSHAAGMGPAVEREVVRAMMLLRARSLAMGYSGTRPVVAEQIVALLNAGITPIVPEHGSLGASGDLAPLAHSALVLVGEGEAETADGRRLGGAESLAAAGLEPLRLTAKEGLALINGTDGILGMLVLACADLAALLRVADIAAAMSVEALLGTDRAFAADLLALRPQPGQQASGANLRRLLDGSEIVASHREDDPRVQDAYSLRCAPQVARRRPRRARERRGRRGRRAADRRSTTRWSFRHDGGRVESCGNFHGAPVAIACDLLAIAAAEVGAIAERRTDRLLDASRSYGLPPFLAADPGVDSGLMIAQYTQAALVAENRRLAAPACVDSIPTSAMQEDHVSMGWSAARKLRTVLANLTRIIAVELTCAARAIDLRAPLRPAAGTAAALAALRVAVPGPGGDRWLAPELAAAERLTADGVLAAVEAEIGELG